MTNDKVNKQDTITAAAAVQLNGTAGLHTCQCPLVQ